LGGKRTSNGILRRFAEQLMDRDVLFEDGLREFLGISENETCADLYGHVRECKHVLVEKIGVDVRKALIPLRETLKRLKEKKCKVGEVVIIMETTGRTPFFRRDRKRFAIDVKTNRNYDIDGVSLRIFTVEEVRRGIVSNFYGGE